MAPRGPCAHCRWAPQFQIAAGDFEVVKTPRVGGGGGGSSALMAPHGCSVQMQSLCSLPIVRYQEPREEDGLEDLTQLE